MSLGREHSKGTFALGKGLAVASATVAGVEAAVHAWTFGTKIGGPPLGAVFMALSMAKTGAQVAALKSQKYASRAGGGGVEAGVPYYVGERGIEIFVPPQSGSIISNDTLSRLGPQYHFLFDLRGAYIQDEDRLKEGIKTLVIDSIEDHIAGGGSIRGVI